MTSSSGKPPFGTEVTWTGQPAKATILSANCEEASWDGLYQCVRAL